MIVTRTVKYSYKIDPPQEEGIADVVKANLRGAPNMEDIVGEMQLGGVKLLSSQVDIEEPTVREVTKW
jgi:hypothetical protein